jgi:hypothetical protein
VWLIGRDDYFVGQILIVLGIKEEQKQKEKKGGCSVK